MYARRQLQALVRRQLVHQTSAPEPTGAPIHAGELVNDGCDLGCEEPPAAPQADEDPRVTELPHIRRIGQARPLHPGRHHRGFAVNSHSYVVADIGAVPVLACFPLSERLRTLFDSTAIVGENVIVRPERVERGNVTDLVRAVNLAHKGYELAFDTGLHCFGALLGGCGAPRAAEKHKCEGGTEFHRELLPRNALTAAAV